MSKTYRSITIVLALWLLAWLCLSWPAMQDDAFIHLRYAVNLLQYHMISYDGVHPDYGTSSLLYVWLLAALRTLVTSALLPRIVSSVFHVLLFAGLVSAFAGSLRGAPKLAQSLALLLLAFLVAPMAVRWLDDGMETSLALCLVSLIAFSTSRLCHSEFISNRSVAWLFLIGLVATLTRIEFLLLFGVVSLTIFLGRLSMQLEETPNRFNVRLRLALRSSAPLLGSLAAAAIIFYKMHAIIPDTAIAKGGNGSAWFGTLGAAFSVLVSSLSFGILLMLFWIVTAVAVIACKRSFSFQILLANSLFPITLLLAAARGQQVQGIRYFVWTLLFPVLWNILELRSATEPPKPSVARALRFATYALAGLFIVLLPIESTLLYKEFRTRARSLAEFRAQHLERLRSMEVTAFDVGYIGYFTGSPLCDMAGLVNGRARARLPFSKRVDLCAAQHPAYAFVSQFSLDELSHRIDLRDWSICSVYDLANLRAPDMHYLIASPAATPSVCAAAGNSPTPLEPLLTFVPRR
jgi:hypothetical protein